MFDVCSYRLIRKFVDEVRPPVPLVPWWIEAVEGTLQCREEHVVNAMERGRADLADGLKDLVDPLMRPV